MDVRIVIVSPPTRKAAHAVKLPVIVGRGDEAKFRVHQDSVSRRHCELFVKDDAVFVRDLGSTNGTLVEGEKIASSVAKLVPPGAQIRVGGLVFRLEYDSAAAVAPAESRGDDTVPMAAVPKAPESEAEPEPEVEPTEAEPIEATQSDAPPATGFAELAADDGPATSAAGFGFLGAAPEPDAPAGGDDKLDDFFKSLK